MMRLGRARWRRGVGGHLFGDVLWVLEDLFDGLDGDGGRLQLRRHRDVVARDLRDELAQHRQLRVVREELQPVEELAHVGRAMYQRDRLVVELHERETPRRVALVIEATIPRSIRPRSERRLQRRERVSARLGLEVAPDASRLAAAGRAVALRERAEALELLRDG